MEISKILSANILDILFEGKNKDYGAYELRTTYNKRMKAALGITAIIVMTVITLTMSNKAGIATNNYIGFDFDPEEPPVQEPIIPPAPKVIKTKVVRTIAYTPPIIVDDTKVIEPPVEVDKLDGRIDIKSNDGEIDNTLSPPNEIKNSSVVLEGPAKKENKADEEFGPIEIEAKFKGNWNAYLQKEIEKNMDELTEAGESGTCIVKFVVSKDGTVSEVQAITMKGTKLAEIAVNAIRKGPKWIPALQNGVPVNAYRQQPVTFKINE